MHPIVQIPNSKDVMAEIGATGSARGPQFGLVAPTTDERGGKRLILMVSSAGFEPTAPRLGN